MKRLNHPPRSPYLHPFLVLSIVLPTLAFSLALVILPRHSEAARQQLARPIQKKGALNAVPGEILVRFRDVARLSKSSQSLSIQSAGRQISIQLERLGVSDEMVSGLRLGRVAPAETADVINSLRARSDVLYAEPNYILRKLQLPNDPRFNEQWSLRNTSQPTADIDAEQAWDVTTGSSNVAVGIIDEGIDISHQDLATNIWTNPGEIAANGIDDDGNGLVDDVHGWDFFHNDNSVYDGPGINPDGSEVDAHGTHVAGIIGAVGNNGIGISGINWQVKLVPIKFLGPNGGSVADAIRAYDYARNLLQAWQTSGGTRGANLRILNNSYGGVEKSQATLDAVRALNTAGILFVAAAGNDARDNDRFPVYPANYNVPNVVSVGASDFSGSLASGFSNYGQRTVDLIAPGDQILSTAPNNSYEAADGTSAAAPHATGVAALVCAAQPNISLSRLRAAVVYGGSPGPTQTTSAGRRVNAKTSLDDAAENDSTPPAAIGNLISTSLGYQLYRLQWTAPGDDGGANGNVAIYQLRYSDTDLSSPAAFEQAFRLVAPVPGTPGSSQGLDVRVPFRHTAGFIGIRAVDNVGNTGPISVIPLNPDIAEADPYTISETAAEPLSTGGTPLNLHADEQYLTYQMPFAFSRFGSSSQGVVVSTNGALHFAFPSQLPNGEPDLDVSLVDYLAGRPMIAGLWDDLRTDKRAGDDVYVVTPDPTRIIFRWQAVTFNFSIDGTPRGENPVNFEIELRQDGTIIIRYGDGNHNVLPVVGNSAGIEDAYVVDSHTSQTTLKDLTLAQTVTFTPRRPAPLPNPDLFVGVRTSPAQAATGQPFTYLIDAGNSSFSQQSEQTVVTNQLPSGVTFVSCTTTRGTCSGPPVGSTGTVTVQLGTLGTLTSLTSSAQIIINVMVTAPVGASLTDTATIAGFWQDVNPSNNTSTAVTDVREPAVFGSVVKISAGSNHNLALQSDGHVWSWGYNLDGELGDGTSSNTMNIPVLVVGLSGVTAIDAGGAHSLALKNNGTVWAWGSNIVGQAGEFEQFFPFKVRPKQVAGLSGQFTAIAAGSSHSLALRSDGTVWAWGGNTQGQLGNGTTSGSPVYTPVQAVNLNNVVAIAAGNSFSLVLRSDGTVWGFGSNQNNALGQPASMFSSSNAVQIPGLTNVAAISAGSLHGLALKQDGSVWAWGDNSQGQLGSGDAPGNFATPRQVSSLSSVTAINAGSQHSLALRSDGTVWSWGRNTEGELGNGTNAGSNVPINVSGLNATAVTAGLFHSGALLVDGTIRMWGANDVGQLGDRTNVNRSSPVQVGASFGVAIPFLTPDGGSFANSIGVGVNSSTQGCVMYFTTDGLEPTENDPAISNGGTIQVTRSLTLKVKAFKPGWPASPTKTATFVLPSSSPTPTPTPIPDSSSKRIAFTRTLANGTDIFLMNGDGTGELNLTNNPGEDKQPSWSPNGTQLAFATYRTGDGLGHLALIRSDGTDLRVVDRHFGTSDSAPVWSPDGTLLAIVSTFPVSGVSNIAVINTDGSNTLASTNNTGISLSPTWSPDGTKIAYALNSPQQPAEIVVAPLSIFFALPQNLTNNSADDVQPAWSPDGTKIAFASNRDSNYEIYIMNADGSNPQRLTNSAGADHAPSWSPDGTKIIFSSERDGGAGEIYIMNANGTNQTRLTNNALEDTLPSLRQTGGSTIQFSNQTFNVSESATSAVITVTRTGDISNSASVNYSTIDDPAPVRCDDTTGNQGIAYARCDYATSLDTLTFATGESSKTFSIPLVNDAYIEGAENVQLALSNPVGANLGSQATATLTIVDDDVTLGANPIDASPFFVRQQYLDFLSREPEPAGFNAWLSVLNNCSNVNNNPDCDRNTVSSSFFRSQEFQLKGFFVYKFYQVTLGRLPTYAEIAADMRKVTGQTSDEVFAKRDAFTEAWVQRQDFKDRFDQLNNGDFVDRLLRNVGLDDLTSNFTRDSLVNDLGASRKTRTQVLRAIIEHPDVDAAEYNGAFVAMQYYGYLRRTPEPAGYHDWLTYLNAHPTDFRTMVNGFMNSVEYRLRFGP